MAKDPAFLFYPNDWLGGTMGMSLEEKGAYIDLLVMQWNCHRIANAHAKRLMGDALWESIKSKFAKDNEGYFNERLEAERKKRQKFSAKQSQNAKKRWGESVDKEAMPPHSVGSATAMPLENENENITISNNKGIVKGRKSFKTYTELDFENEVKSFSELSEYHQAFIDYWTEPSANGTMKFQLQKTWDTKRRLQSWASNNFQKTTTQNKYSHLPYTPSPANAVPIPRNRRFQDE